MQNRVLVVGMTNRLSALDPAVVRRTSITSSKSACHQPKRSPTHFGNLLLNVPTDAIVDFDVIGDALAGRPLSDVGFVVREACRLAARNRKEAVGNEELSAALSITPNRPSYPVKRRIGFV